MAPFVMTSKEEREMSVEENKAIVRRYFEEENKKNVAVVDELITANFVGHGAGGQEVHGPEGLKQLWTTLFTGFPDYHATVEDLIAEGDKIVVRYTNWGTHNGEYLDTAPTGKQVTWTGMLIFRIVGGKVIEGWRETDALSLMQQIGAIPTPGQG